MKSNKLPFTFLALLVAFSAMAQTTPPAPHPPLEMPVETPPLAPLPEPQPTVAPPPSTPAIKPSAEQSTAVGPTSANEPLPVAKNEIRMNFQNASLADVLNYLSEAAGFVIVQDTPVTGTVNIVSKQSINVEEAVDLLNTVLISKGYIAIRNGRILKIVSSHDAQKNDLPVAIGSDPEKIPRKDGMVTQILPIRYLEAPKLLDNLRPLLSADSTISANETSNAILLTDTQTNIHRIAQIIHSLDTSISSISSIHVFQLRYADAKDFASVLTQLFSPDQSASSRNGQNNQNVPPFFARFGRGGGGETPAPPESEARKAASRVTAVADEQSNSVVVSAPEEYMATITEIVNRLDTSVTDSTETRIFRLEHADSSELANVLNSLYGDNGSTGTSTNRGNGNQAQNGQRTPGGGRQQQQNNNPNNNGNAVQPSERSLLQARVVAVPDPRTNSIVVSCSRDTMDQIALTIGRLDASDSKKQHVYVHVLEHADPDNVATILRGMFGGQSASSNSNQPTSNALNQRTTTGASSDIQSTLSTGGNSGGANRSGR